MIDPNNDADMLTLEFESAARDAANGVCSICDEELNPADPKWGNTPEHIASIVSCYGPALPNLPFHTLCWQDRN